MYILQVVLDVQFMREPSAGIPLKSSSLKWWDILMIALGCVAAATCPLLLVLAVSHLRMRVPDASSSAAFACTFYKNPNSGRPYVSVRGWSTIKTQWQEGSARPLL